MRPHCCLNCLLSILLLLVAVSPVSAAPFTQRRSSVSVERETGRATAGQAVALGSPGKPIDPRNRLPQFAAIWLAEQTETANSTGPHRQQARASTFRLL